MEFEDEEYSQFLQDLQQYPNYFQMVTENCSSNFWRKISQKIEDEKENEKEELLEFSDLVRIKNENLEACASYKLGDVDKAEQIISKVLEETNSTSINACAMMAILNYKKGESTKAVRLLNRIKELAADPYNIDVAKSELAHAYTRLNPIFYKKAIALYTDVVEKNPHNIPWIFGLAVLYRRCMTTTIHEMFPDIQLETCFNEAEKYLTYVPENCTDEKDRFFKARSYIELADLYSTANTTHILFTNKNDIIDLVDQGVQCLPRNTTILRKGGRILRHCFEFEKAKELLQKAYDICPNSYICHQLGLSQKNSIIYHHKQSKLYPKRDQRHGRNKWNRELSSGLGPSYPFTLAPKQPQVNKQFDQQSEYLASVNDSKSLKQFDNSLSSESGKEPELNQLNGVSTKALTEQKPILKHDENIKNTVHDNDLEVDLAIAEPVYQHSFPHVSPYQTTVKRGDQVQRGTHLLDCTSSPHGSPDPFYPKSLKTEIQDDDLDPGRKKDHQHSALEKAALDDPSKTLATGGPTILPNESKTEKELSDTLSNVSLTNIVRGSSLPPPHPVSENVSSGPTTTTTEKSELQNNPVVKMSRLINSPGNETFDLELSRKLDPCLDLFRQSAELGHERNMMVYYDWGITLLQMIPTKFDEVMEKFNHILDKDRSKLFRYRCYEQYGICKLRMSESQDFDENSREVYRQDSKKMFTKAIRCWAFCKKLNLSEHFNYAEGNCNSLRSIREILFGDDSRHGTKPKEEMASLYYLVQQYDLSLSLYQEVYDEHRRTSDTALVGDVIKGIINNHLQLKQYTDVLDLLDLLLCSKEGLQCFEFKTEVLKQMIHYSIDTNDYNLSESVFNFEKDRNEECDNDVLIIFNDKDQVTKKKGTTLQNWLCAFSNSCLKVINSNETAANLPRLQEQVKLIYNSKMAIFILTNETPSTELTYLMNTALEALCNDNYFLKTIFPIVINDGMVPDICKTFRSMKITHQPNIADDQDKSEFMKTFSEIFLEKAT